MRKSMIRNGLVFMALVGMIGMAGCGGDNSAHDSESPVQLLAQLVEGESVVVFANTNDACTEIRDVEFTSTPIDPGLGDTQFNNIVIDGLLISYDNLTMENIPGVTIPPPVFLSLASDHIGVNDTYTLFNIPFLSFSQKLSPPLDGSGAPLPLEMRANMVLQGHLFGDEDVIVTSEFSIGVTVFDSTPTPDLDGDGCPDTDQDICACG